MAERPRPSDPSDGGAGPSERGWGSPVPAEYGSLRSLRSQAEDGGSELAARSSRSRQAGTGWIGGSGSCGGRSGSEVAEPVADLNSGAAPTDRWTSESRFRPRARFDGAVASNPVRSAGADHRSWTIAKECWRRSQKSRIWRRRCSLLSKQGRPWLSLPLKVEIDDGGRSVGPSGSDRESRFVTSTS